MENLVKLEGTEKQVAWAEDIRSKMFKSLESYIEMYRDQVAKMNASAEDKKRVNDGLDKVLSSAAGIVDAEWFIDNRDDTNYYDAKIVMIAVCKKCGLQ
jgi:vacuolar-type H+-ATPase subunit E/Vma4